MNYDASGRYLHLVGCCDSAGSAVRMVVFTLTGEAVIRFAWHLLWFGYGVTIGILIERYWEENK